MGSCYNKIDNYFFPEDLSMLFSFSIVAPFNVYRIVRFVLCALITAAFIWNQTTFPPGELWMQVIYLTEWSLWLTFLYFLLATGDLLSYRFRARTIWQGAWKLQTVLFVTALVNEFVVTIIFWSILLQYQSKDFWNIMLNLAIHLFPLIALTIDGVMNPIIIKTWRPQIYVLLIDGAYFTVNIIYSLMVKPVYVPITYRDLMSYVYLTAGLVLGFIQFWFFKFVVVGKIKIRKAEDKMDVYKESLLEGPAHDQVGMDV